MRRKRNIWCLNQILMMLSGFNLHSNCVVSEAFTNLGFIIREDFSDINIVNYLHITCVRSKIEQSAAAIVSIANPLKKILFSIASILLYVSAPALRTSTCHKVCFRRPSCKYYRSVKKINSRTTKVFSVTRAIKGRGGGYFVPTIKYLLIVGYIASIIACTLFGIAN